MPGPFPPLAGDDPAAITPAPTPRIARWCFFSPGHRSLRVLLGDSRTSGGAEAQVAHLAATLAARGDSVSLIYGDGRGAEPVRTLSGITCHDAAPAWRRPASLAVFWRTLRQLRPDVLYARLPSDFLWMLALAARRRPGARFVYALAHDLHARGDTACDHRRWFHAPLHDLGLAGAHAVAIQHGGQVARCPQRLHGRLAEVPNVLPGQDGPRAGQGRPYAETEFDAVWVARIRPEKRLDDYLALARAHPDLAFALVGGFDPSFPPAERAALEHAIRTLPNLTWFGERRATEVLDLIRRARVLVNTSAHEGFPNTMLEAWSLAVPVLSRAVDPGGVIRRRGLGIVAPEAARMADCLRAMARDPILNARFGRRGLAYVRRHHGAETVCMRLRAAALPEGVFAEEGAGPRGGARPAQCAEAASAGGLRGEPA